jgi:hypothetical protein
MRYYPGITIVLCALLVLVASPGFAEQDERVTQARDLILQLCSAITKRSNSIEVSGESGSLHIKRTTSSGQNHTDGTLRNTANPNGWASSCGYQMSDLYH